MIDEFLTTLRRRAVLPLYEQVYKRRRIAQRRRFLEQSQWWPREKLLEFQWRELTTLLAHAWQQVPYWKSTLDRAGIVPSALRSYEDFLRVPITEKAHIRQYEDQMIARDYRGKTWVKATAGSTGEPLRLHYTPESYDWRVAISRRGYSWAGYEEGMRQLSIWGVFAIGKRPFYADFKDRFLATIAGRTVVNSLKFDDTTLAECLATVNRTKPDVVVGYANPLYEFAQFVNRHGGLTARPKAAISAAEKIYDYQRLEIERALHCPMFETYGSREFMLIGSECDRKSGLHLSTENLFIEVIKEDGRPAAPGETGDLVITDLHNFGMPFIRYRIGDIAVASDVVCPCGRGLPILQQIVGRTLDVIRTRSGQNVPGEFFPHLLKEVKGVRQFQVVQPDLDTLVIRIVKDAAFTDAEEALLRREVGRLFGGTINLAVEFVAAIPLTKAGKLRMTISHVGQR
jgi:phenylacetate-CoA ligase